MDALLRFRDLKARKIASSYTQLKRLQDDHGFPSGRLLGPNSRAWTEEEVAQWFANRPIERKALATVVRGEDWHEARRNKKRRKVKRRIATAHDEGRAA